MTNFATPSGPGSNSDSPVVVVAPVSNNTNPPLPLQALCITNPLRTLSAVAVGAAAVLGALNHTAQEIVRTAPALAVLCIPTRMGEIQSRLSLAEEVHRGSGEVNLNINKAANPNEPTGTSGFHEKLLTRLAATPVPASIVRIEGIAKQERTWYEATAMSEASNNQMFEYSLTTDKGEKTPYRLVTNQNLSPDGRPAQVTFVTNLNDMRQNKDGQQVLTPAPYPGVFAFPFVPSTGWGTQAIMRFGPVEK